ncbi:uncharacterized protein CELE_C14A4.7 [Caenorhabditis elegans]|uniref:Transmembrane protein n=1 Tax=Caenorhabditis elegans TaxID=6239 RepID=Q7JMG5_CAEEL|nr:Transmembrane protein [Caenorhabditis elegans]CAE54884.1 Transmembrane protein [Caenorhabditis elegans]|eukprot:NP_001021952.1 Uncharacterized protein CELE_C14A4.7 [Caenorhabditis elegans]
MNQKIQCMRVQVIDKEVCRDTDNSRRFPPKILFFHLLIYSTLLQMTLRFERFRHFPESGKTITLLLSAVLGLVLSFTDLHYPKEAKFFWISFWISFAFDVITILILLKDWDENVEWMRKAPYSVIVWPHCSSAFSFLCPESCS